MKYIYNIEKTKDYTEKIDFEEKIGKKAQNLLELAVQGFNVPKFSVVTNKYFREVILNEIKEYNRKEGNEDEISDWNSIFDENTERKTENIVNKNIGRLIWRKKWILEKNYLHYKIMNMGISMLN